MELHSGGYYVTAKPQIIGPIGPSQTHDKWKWSWQGPDGWMHWTAAGKYRTLGESSHDIVREASEAEIAALHKYGNEEVSPMPDHMGNAYVDAKTGEKITEKSPMTKHRLLDLAKEATADRGLNYGKPEANFERIATHWNAFLANRYGVNSEGKTFVSVTLSAEDVAMMMALMKLARLEHSPSHQDSWVDLAGYAACGAEIALSTGHAQETKPAERPWQDWAYTGELGYRPDIGPNLLIEVEFRSGRTDIDHARNYDWAQSNRPSDIMRWRLA